MPRRVWYRRAIRAYLSELLSSQYVQVPDWYHMVLIYNRATRAKSRGGKMWLGRERHGTETGNHVVFCSRPRVPGRSVLGFCSRCLPSRCTVSCSVSCSRPDCFSSHLLSAEWFPSHPDVRQKVSPICFVFTTGFLVFPSYDDGTLVIGTYLVCCFVQGWLRCAAVLCMCCAVLCSRYCCKYSTTYIFNAPPPQ